MSFALRQGEEFFAIVDATSVIEALESRDVERALSRGEGVELVAIEARETRVVARTSVVRAGGDGARVCWVIVAPLPEASSGSDSGVFEAGVR